MRVSRVAATPSSTLYRVSPIHGEQTGTSLYKRMAVYTSSFQDIMVRSTGDKSISRTTITTSRESLCYPYPCRTLYNDQSSSIGKHLAAIYSVNFSLRACFTSFDSSSIAGKLLFQPERNNKYDRGIVKGGFRGVNTINVFDPSMVSLRRRKFENFYDK